MNKIDFRKQNIPFTQVANGVLYDKNLSLQAKALYAYMYSKPDGWEFSSIRMGKDLGVNRNTVNKYINELKKSGYLLSQKLPDGHVIYKIIFPPIEPDPKFSAEGDPLLKKASVEKSLSGKFQHISNTELNTNKEGDNPPAGAYGDKPLTGKQWNQLIDGFEPVNPMFRNFYKRKVERNALENVVKAIGFEETIRYIELLPSICQQQYAPKITRPVELQGLLAKLQLFIKQQKPNLSPGTPYTKGKYADNKGIVVEN